MKKIYKTVKEEIIREEAYSEISEQDTSDISRVAHFLCDLREAFESSGYDDFKKFYDKEVKSAKGEVYHVCTYNDFEFMLYYLYRLLRTDKYDFKTFIHKMNIMSNVEDERE